MQHFSSYVGLIASIALTACAAGSHFGGNGGAGSDGVASSQRSGPPSLTTIDPQDTRLGRPIFGTVNPGPRAGRKLLSQHLIGQLGFGLEYDNESLAMAARDKLEAAKTTEQRETWMDVVSANSHRYRGGQGEALMIGVDPLQPKAGAQEFVKQYLRLSGIIYNTGRDTRTNNAELLLQAYRDTLAARQDVAMLLQVEPRIEHFEDYARLEAGRRVIGDVLIRAGVLVERSVEQDFVDTHGFLAPTAIALTAFEGPDFGMHQILLADDRSQQSHAASPEGAEERRYVQAAYRQIAREAQRYNDLASQRARAEL